MHILGICGHFGGDKIFADGQTIKTKQVTKVLIDKFGLDKISFIDTFQWKRNILKKILSCIKLFQNCDAVVILPAQNGIKILVPLFLLLNIYYDRKLYYIVIGGWLPDYAEKSKYISYFLKKLSGIYVETHGMQEKLSQCGFENIFYLPNFKKIRVLKSNELNINFKKPFPLCTFSRVMKEKGIEESIDAVTFINESSNEVVYTLDIYGAIENSYRKQFDDILQNSKSYIKYCGIVDENNSVNNLKAYFLLLFPTYYQGEGFPGTFIDSFAAGVPILASDWHYNSEIIANGKTGFIFPVKQTDKMIETLIELSKNPITVYEMKKACIIEAEKYTPDLAMDCFINKLKML